MAYSYEHDPVNADAIPLYNDSILKIWNWFNDKWSCNDWLVWHNANDQKYGREKANEKFMYYWNDLALVTTTADCKTWDNSFRAYMRSVGLMDSIGNFISNAIGDTQESIGNVSAALRKTTKTASVILPLILIIIGIFAVIYFAKSTKSIK